MDKPRGQHFVAKSYLRKFASGRERLFAFDKKECRSFGTSIGNVAKERDFYDLPPDVAAKTGIDPKLFEGGYGRLVDDRLMRDLHEFIEHSPSQPTDWDARVHVAQFIVFQYGRTRSALNLGKEISQKFVEHLVDDLMRKNFSEEEQKYKPQVVLPDGYVQLMMNAALFDNLQTYPMVATITHRKWTLGLNQSGVPLYTSDSPVCLRVTGPADGVALMTPTAQIILPVTSKHLLMVGTAFLPPGRPTMPHAESCELRNLSRRDVAAFNRLQTIQSSRYIYCETDTFDVARQMCEEDPSVRDPQPARVCIRVGPETTDGSEIRQTVETVVGTRDHAPKPRTK